MKKWVYIIMFFNIFYGCKSFQDTFDFNNPEIKASYPSNYQVGIPNEASIWVEFTEKMNRSSVERALSFSGGVYTLHWDSDARIRLIPEHKLLTGIQYILTIDSFAEDKNGNKLSKRFILNFTVNEDVINPYIETIAIEGFKDNGDFSYIDPEELPIDRRLKPIIQITFSEPMDEEKTLLGIDCGEIKYISYWDIAMKKLTIEPIEDLIQSSGKKYSIVIGEKVVDIAGNPLRESLSRFFYIGSDHILPEVKSIFLKQVQDDQSLTNIDLMLPIYQGLILPNIYPKSSIVVEFSKKMDIQSLHNAFTLSPSIELKEFYLDECTLIINLNEVKEYNYGSTYSLKISTEAKDLAGNGLKIPVEKQFFVGNDFNKPELINFSYTKQDSTGVILSSIDLVSGEKCFLTTRRPKFYLTFNKPMNQISVNNAIAFSPSISSNLIKYTWIDMQKLEIEILSDLNYGMQYTLTVNTSAFDVSQKLSLEKDVKIIFFVGDPLDFLKITGVKYFHQDNLLSIFTELEVPVKTRIELLFNYPINGYTTRYIQLSDYTLTTEEFIIDGNKLIIQPKNALTPGKYYQLTFPKSIESFVDIDPFRRNLEKEEYISFVTRESDRFYIEALTMNSSEFIVNAQWLYPLPIYTFSETADAQLNCQIQITFSNSLDENSVRYRTKNVVITRESADGVFLPYIDTYSIIDPEKKRINFLIKNIEKGHFYRFFLKDSETGVKSQDGVTLEGAKEILFITPGE